MSTPSAPPAQHSILLLDEVAALVRKSPGTLRWWRHQGIGPASFKLGRRVAYDRAVVDAWVDEQRQAG